MATSTSVHQVHGTDDNWFFSDGVSRSFGDNRFVRLADGRIVFSVVQPANEWHKLNLPVVGEIENELDQVESK